MVKIYKGVFDYQPKRIKHYVEELCGGLLKLDQITQTDIERFKFNIRKKQDRLPFKWQKENMEQEAKERLDELLSNYEYEPKSKVYIKK